ncbi:TetR/AcrR family transcriptional regulator C-terminal domain-containing protein [Janibacter indicus]|uniref:TetR/AcrR family transcriptional regulator C-terminal domain-containing protein n=1 Tax=Janibacter indicus TaxID=857417 RepID=A0A7L9J009_9MICO|nr:TetR/AcrR family transcriptional regulator C-terminal domain-containing protein [Janibacter indicus]QOK22393.1 TetR/AcrR family transcriptional regulator C-terminal domain-containing protein [Janibacter indicus]
MNTVPDPPSDSRPRLDRDLIVQTAIASIDTHGVQGLTMRRVGQELDVAAMSLYRYVSGREALLEAVVEKLLDDVTDRADAVGFTSWQEYLQVLANEVRRVAQAHPAAFPLVASRHPATPWLRPPLRSIELVEHFLATLSDFGFDKIRAVDAYKTFTTFLIGSLLLEVAAHGKDILSVDETLNEGEAAIPEQDAHFDLQQAPHVCLMQDRLSQDTTEQEFEIGLEALIDRIERSVSQ